jgi:hypothetical protein
MAFLVTPIAGADLTAVAASGTTAPFTLGVTAIGNDGKLYVYGQASGSISGGTTTCTVNASTFAVSGTAGSYTSPAAALNTGDKAWFAKALV